MIRFFSVALFPISACLLVACPAPSQDDLCTSDGHCYREDGQVFCEDGYDWEDAGDPNNYNCVAVDVNEPEASPEAEPEAGPEAEPESEPESAAGLPVLGNYTHSIDEVELTEIAGGEVGLARPRDLEFHPRNPDQLWIVSQGMTFGASAVIVLFEPTAAVIGAGLYNGPGNFHFLARPSALAFSDDPAFPNFATAHDEDEETQGPVSQGGTPADFMGPTLWPADAAVFEGGHASHMDMLHNSPNAVGIAWEVGNAYWVFDGYHSSLTRYDFVDDHDLAGVDHSDGIVARYVEGEVSYVPEVSSHLVFDHTSSLLYVADTGNNRIAVLDTTTGTRGSNVFPNYDSGGGFGTGEQYRVDDAVLTTLVDGDTVTGMGKPSGLEMHDGILYVSDYDSSIIYAFDKDGNLLDWLETGLGAGCVMGMAIADDGSIYLVDSEQDKVLRIAPKPAE